MRDLGALLALPSLWVDHSPAEITDGLLSILVGMLDLDAAFARFEIPAGGAVVEGWRPSGQVAPPQLFSGDAEPVATVELSLPWGSGLAVVAAARAGFPTEREAHLLRVAMGQAAIALHTARRLAAEQEARREAERALARQQQVLRSLLDEATSPAAPRALHAVPASDAAVVGRAHGAVSSPSAPDAAKLTRPEIEVLGLLAQGLSNKEMAALMWLSDRTIERHITSLYRKIGVGRRSEATAYALRHGIA
jgi:DNA-binding CsgD family transcriptional regulator